METHQIKETLLQAIHVYEHMLNDMQNLEIEIGTASPATLMKFNESLKEQQDNVEKIEHDLFTQLSNSCNSLGEIDLLIKMREKLMKDILFLNQQITIKASGIRSFMSHEMKRLHSGYTAMKGYKQIHHNHGRIVNSTT